MNSGWNLILSRLTRASYAVLAVCVLVHFMNRMRTGIGLPFLTSVIGRTASFLGVQVSVLVLKEKFT
jgi:hypothetical protein